MKMATMMTTKYFAVLQILVLISLCASEDAGYRFEDGVGDSKYDVHIQESVAHHQLVKRQAAAATPVSTISTPTPESNDVSSTSTAMPQGNGASSTTISTIGSTMTTYPDEVNLVHGNHTYYKSRTYRNLLGAHYYKEASEIASSRVHNALSDNHRTASSVDISFTFPFYGHGVKKITIATGGFLYMSPFLHQWLTATQYIAPLMANFDTQLGNHSKIIYADTGSAFYVWWENVLLQDEAEAGPFTFQVQLHQNGEIIFAYKHIPKDAHLISTEEHPVKIGLSDAYYIDTTLSGNMKRRTIYEYHRVEIQLSSIESYAAVRFQPETLCQDMQNCHQCATAQLNFDCLWCPSMRRCTDGIDRYRQEFLEANCHLQNVSASSVEECDALNITTGQPTTVDDTTFAAAPVTTTVLPLVTEKVVSGCDRSKNGVENKSDCTGNNLESGVLVVVILVVILLVALIIALVGWFVYAYRHPNSKSGRWLIEHRPSQLRAQLAKVRFWKKDSGSAGDKYAVSVGGETVA